MNLKTLGIDASNIISGGGLTHLSMVLSSINPLDYGFGKVVIWSNKNTLERLPEWNWLLKINPPVLNNSMPFRFFWQQFILPFCISGHGCDLLFSPGGTLPVYSPAKAVVIPQNMLIFDDDEAARYEPGSIMKLRIKMLRFFQGRSLKMADGVIFLTKYAKKSIIEKIQKFSAKSRIVGHGIERRFFCERHGQTVKSKDDTYRILYVSIVDVYKHQIEVAAAVDKLVHDGYDLNLDFVGGAYGPQLEKLNSVLDKFDYNRRRIKYHGPLPFDELHKRYQECDIFIFASSCENLPIILLEAMASGAKIASSDKPPMPEVLKNGGVYFNCEDHYDIARAIVDIIEDQDAAEKRSDTAVKLAEDYSWEKCARETFGFLEDCC